jgi:hypothetical protein
VTRHFKLLMVASLLAAVMFAATNHHWQANAAPQVNRFTAIAREGARPGLVLNYGQRLSDRRAPGPAIEPYVRPEFAAQMYGLRDTILEAAARHNHADMTGMSDRDFAALIALVMYNEHFGWFEERVTPVQALTPFYEDLQLHSNRAGLSNLSVWPVNIRPSVALEILRQQVPLPHSDKISKIPVTVAGSTIKPDAFDSQGALYGAITAEISDPKLAVEYLAANLERGVYRARYENVPVTWRALAAWHNQGVVAPEDIRANPVASDYVRRASAYIGKARALIDLRPPTIPPSKLNSLDS